MAELWGGAVASVLFWGLANELTSTDEAKAYFPMFSVMANVSLVAAGELIARISRSCGATVGGDGWSRSLRYLMGSVILSSAAISALHQFIRRQAKSRPDVFSNETRLEKAPTALMGFRESMYYLASMKYIRHIALEVICFGMSLSMIEVTWKTKLKQAYPSPESYSKFMGRFSAITGVVTIAMLIISQQILRRNSWRTASLITPTTLLSTGLCFFLLLIASNSSHILQQYIPLLRGLDTTSFNASILKTLVMVGGAQNMFSKTCKYTLFDPLKELAYKPLDYETKCKGKAAIDVIGNPLGKSGNKT
eukprot:GHVQ01013038.1.p1 GENE.GHVQ01013038.1~~GHVQ01013038.1.p1  ORF type:complete len:307 (+),score=33.58 GHVQ01013038.1:315-1235(+)